MARHTIRVYTDYRSPYAYLADADIQSLESKYDVTLDWYPYILPIEQYLGTEDNRTGHQWRRIKYAYKDARRLAEEQGLVLYGAKRLFDGYYSSAGLLYAKENGFFPAYHKLVFSRVFNRDLEIDDLSAMAQAVEQAGGSADAFRDWAEGDGREAVSRWSPRPRNWVSSVCRCWSTMKSFSGAAIVSRCWSGDCRKTDLRLRFECV